MFKLLIIGAGGFFGAILRYQVSGWVHNLFGSHFPYGTFAVNIVGSFLLGFFLVLADTKFILPDMTKQFVAIGILGAFTTFSTFSYETMSLFQVSLWKQALLNMALNVVVGLIAVWLGMITAKLV